MSSTFLHPSLPPKPNFSTSEPQYAYDAEQPEASSSSAPPKPICATCNHECAKYTCPGCSIRTCSATCSSTHKSKTGCTGVRDKARYVPMKEYSWGKMMDDYTFLEEMGRKVGDWGKEIVRGGYSAGSATSRGRGNARGRGRGARGRGGGVGPVKTRRDILKMHLEVWDIDMELLPAGMEKRKANQSSWDTKNKTALLTIEFKFYKPKDPLAPSSEPRAPPFILTTTRNNVKSPLLTLIRSQLQERTSAKKEGSCPDWVKRLVFPDADDPESFTNPQCVMAAQLDPIATGRLQARPKKIYHSFDPTQTLVILLRHTHFVEFPTIEIWDEFLGPIVDEQGVLRRQQQEMPLKRRKMNPKAGRLAIAGLLGGYGSESDEVGENGEPQNMLAALGDYIESEEDEDAASLVEAEGHIGGLEDVDIGDLSDDEEEVEVDASVLLELMRKVREGEPWGVEEDEAVDWGDMDDGELE
ncbi:hypothetical protein GALMADRAFT_235534 [Galerina marginata CBS 339.88]|uniref:HIT-type domain-containing protein n=1 Tax=Galerina marginata (strain CBS 339.88) TaxID=685588 RepID=A0A067TM59_GALM3|nr:hypothetical protein GALMADRAFT_235534 [Galerina marginata CBS 339.88]